MISALVSAFLRYTTGADMFFLIYFGLTVILLLLILPYLKITYYLAISIILACLFFFAFPTLLDSERPIFVSLYLLMHLFSSIVIGYALFINPLQQKIASLIFILFSAFFVYKTYEFGLFNPDAYNSLLASGSRNIVATFLLFITVFLISTYQKEQGYIPVPYLVITFVFCVLLYGRTGIALSFLLLLFFSYSRLRFAYKALLIVLSIAFLTYIANSLYVLIMEKTNFAIGFESDRFDMYKEYLSDLNFYEIIFGQDYQECCQTIVSFDNNPHNSFIDGHSKYGVVHTLLYLYIFARILSKNLPLFILGAVLLVKYNTDTVGLFAPIDFVLFYLFFLSLYHHQLNSSTEIKAPKYIHT